jgi:palmitoyltransferase ZDHHC9/14/18
LIESKNRFYCDGRCVTGRDVGIFIFAVFLITITSALFFGFEYEFIKNFIKKIFRFFEFSCPYLTQRLSPIVPVFAGILYLSVICFIFRTACSDPGILPRATSDEVLYLERSSKKKIL